MVTQSTLQPKVHIIGIGNPFRSDDALGWNVLDQYTAPPSVQTSRHSGEGTGLMALWEESKSPNVILIDAMEIGVPAGTVKRWDAIKVKLVAKGIRCSSHAFGVIEAIALARQLGKIPKRLTLIAVEGKNFTMGTEFTREVRNAIPKVLKILTKEVETCMK